MHSYFLLSWGMEFSIIKILVQNFVTIYLTIVLIQISLIIHIAIGYGTQLNIHYLKCKILI